MARKMVKSFFKHPAPVPHRGAEGGSGRGGSKMNLTKKNSSGNGLKWQENWSNHFFLRGGAREEGPNIRPSFVDLR